MLGKTARPYVLIAAVATAGREAAERSAQNFIEILTGGVLKKNIDNNCALNCSILRLSPCRALVETAPLEGSPSLFSF